MNGESFLSYVGTGLNSASIRLSVVLGPYARGSFAGSKNGNPIPPDPTASAPIPKAAASISLPKRSTAFGRVLYTSLSSNPDIPFRISPFGSGGAIYCDSPPTWVIFIVNCGKRY